MFEVYIVNRPFYEAGKKFGWEGPSAGLGISLDKLEGSGSVMVKVRNKEAIYTIDKREAIALAEQYNSYTEFDTKKGRVKLAIIPWSKFETFDDEANGIKDSTS